jgi:hypothetical protein
VPHLLRGMLAQRDFGGLAVHWRVFGSSGHLEPPQGGVLQVRKPLMTSGRASPLYMLIMCRGATLEACHELRRAVHALRSVCHLWPLVIGGRRSFVCMPAIERPTYLASCFL